MGVRMLEGQADGTTPATALYCSTSGEMLGTIWEGESSYDAAQGFVEWVASMAFARDDVTPDLDLDPMRDLPAGGKDGTDVRHWPTSGLAKLETYYRRRFVGPDGAPRDS